MSEYVPTTEGAQSYYVAGRTQMRRQLTGEQAIDVTEYSHEFNRWLAKRDAEVAAKAWDEGREAEELAWEHAFNGHPVPEGEVCDECVVENPYRKAVQS